MSVRIGIMQGRLLPPVSDRIQDFPKDRWPEEFAIARDLELDNIEFIFDTGGDDIERHPLLETGCPAIRGLVERSGVKVSTICADYFMSYPVHESDERELARSVRLLTRLVDNTRRLGITDVVLPCVDQSSLTTAEDRKRLVHNLRPVVSICEEKGVNLALETDLGPDEFEGLLTAFDSTRVTVNYDLGNSASLGYDPVEEWEAYGDRVSSVHIKDRVLNGSTVPLGTGAARFEEFFDIAHKKGFDGLFVLQAARGEDETATARSYIEFLRSYLQRYICA